VKTPYTLGDTCTWDIIRAREAALAKFLLKRAMDSTKQKIAKYPSDWKKEDTLTELCRFRGLQKDLDDGELHAFFNRQLTLQTTFKDIEFENSDSQDAFVKDTVNQIMPVFQFQRKNSESPVVPFKFWKKSQKWVARKIANKKAKPETGGTALEMMRRLNIPEMKR